MITKTPTYLISDLPDCIQDFAERYINVWISFDHLGVQRD